MEDYTSILPDNLQNKIIKYCNPFPDVKMHDGKWNFEFNCGSYRFKVKLDMILKHHGITIKTYIKLYYYQYFRDNKINFEIFWFPCSDKYKIKFDENIQNYMKSKLDEYSDKYRYIVEKIFSYAQSNIYIDYRIYECLHGGKILNNNFFDYPIEIKNYHKGCDNNPFKYCGYKFSDELKIDGETFKFDYKS